MGSRRRKRAAEASGETPVASQEPKESKEEKEEVEETQPKRSKAENKFEDELKCIVCMDFPPGHIYQCKNGHLLCSDCHARIIELPKTECPTCRIHLSRDKPARNMFAENVLKTVVVQCTNTGCSEKVKFGSLKQHIDKECPFKMTVCKFATLGCDWKGIASKQKEHQDQCEVKKMSATQILKRIQSREEKKGKKVDTAQKNKDEIIRQLSSRARDIAVRDVILERDEICNEVCSKTFMALGYAWEVLLTKTKSAKQAALEIRMVSSLRRKMKLTFFILRGPYVNLEIHPSLHSVEFRNRSSHQSITCILNTDEETARSLFEMDSQHFRIGFVDHSHGTSRSFSNEQDMMESDLDSSDTDDSALEEFESDSYSDTDDDGDFSEDSIVQIGRYAL